MAVLIFFVAHWYLSLFCQSFFHHRYSAHRMFTMSKAWEKFFFVLSWITQGSSYLSPRAYGAMHRLHHAYADTEKDPHSPKWDKNVFTMMWRTKKVYTDVFHGRAKLAPKFLKDLPEWAGFDGIGERWPSRIFWGLAYLIFYIFFATQWWMFLLLPIHFVMGPVHGAIINWLAHKYGYRNFNVKDTSKNLLPVDFLMWGEGFHNNHHKFGGRANFGVKWFEIDPMYPIIWVMDKLRIIQLRRKSPEVAF